MEKLRMISKLFLKLTPKFNYFFKIGEVKYYEEDKSEAINYLDRSIAIDKNNAAAYNLRAKLKKILKGIMKL